MRIAPFLISKIFSFAEDMSVGGGTPRAEALMEVEVLDEEEEIGPSLGRVLGI